MEIEIKKLTPELADDYARFFDTTPHATGKEEHRCYCVWWCADDSEGKDFSTPEKRRAAAIDYIRNGKIQGYLAYCGGEAVGWLNANTKADCLKCYCWRRFMGAVETKEAPGTRVKSVFCFAVAPKMRRMGVAAMLLERACRDAASDGFDFIEAYPNREFAGEADDYMGPAGLFEKSGFAAWYEAGRILVMRKKLN